MYLYVVAFVGDFTKWKSKIRVTSSNQRVRRLKTRVAKLKARVGRSKARVKRLKTRFEAKKYELKENSEFKLMTFTSYKKFFFSLLSKC